MGQRDAYSEVGWGGYYDEREPLGSVAGMGALSTFQYVPDLGPVGHGSDGSYYPRDTSQDAAALNFLAFYPDPAVATHVGTTGSQRGDMSQGAGAWDPDFQQAVRDFQSFAGLTQDGWIGPNTRAAIAAAVTAKNLRAAPNAPPQPIPPGLPPFVPGLPIPQPGAQPAPAQPGAKAAGGQILGMSFGVAAAVALGVAVAAYAVYKLV